MALLPLCNQSHSFANIDRLSNGAKRGISGLPLLVRMFHLHGRAAPLASCPSFVLLEGHPKYTIVPER